MYSTSVLDTLRATVRNEGIAALYKGVKSPLTATPPIYAISFASWGWAQAKATAAGLTQQGREEGSVELTPLGLFLSGAVSGAVQSVIWAPMELLKKRMMIETAKPVPLLTAARTVVAQEGIAGLYRGYPVVASFFIPACGIWYGSYDLYKRALNKDPTSPSTVNSLVAGGMAGMSSWGFLFPFDTVAAHVQTKKLPFKHVVLGLWREGGVRAFYRGLGPCLARACVADAACFAAYEMSMRLITRFELL